MHCQELHLDNFKGDFLNILIFFFWRPQIPSEDLRPKNIFSKFPAVNIFTILQKRIFD